MGNKNGNMIKNHNLQTAIKEAKQLVKKHPKEIEAAYIYGSILEKKDANDADIMLIIKDDPETIKGLYKIQEEIESVFEENKKKGVIIHIQPPKPISLWWRLLLEGEPWVVTSLQNPLIIKDSKNIVREASKLVEKGILFKKEEKAEKLLERAEQRLIKNRELLLHSISLLSEAATEAAQIFLLFDNKLLLSKKKIAFELLKHSEKLGKETINTYEEIVDLEEKMEKGLLTGFTAENLEHYEEKVDSFIRKIENIITDEDKG